MLFSITRVVVWKIERFLKNPASQQWDDAMVFSHNIWLDIDDSSHQLVVDVLQKDPKIRKTPNVYWKKLIVFQGLFNLFFLHIIVAGVVSSVWVLF